MNVLWNSLCQSGDAPKHHSRYVNNESSRSACLMFFSSTTHSSRGSLGGTVTVSLLEIPAVVDSITE